MLVEPGNVFLCKFKREHPLDLRGGMEFLDKHSEMSFTDGKEAFDKWERDTDIFREKMPVAHQIAVDAPRTL